MFDVWLGNMYVKKRNIIIAIIALLVIGGAVATFAIRPWQREGYILGYGNTPSNISSRGQVAQNEEWIVSLTGAAGWIFTTCINGTDRQMIDSRAGTIGNLNVIGDWIYHTRTYAHIDVPAGRPSWYSGGIYRMQLDGTRLERVSDDNALFVNVVDGWIYYANLNSIQNLYRIRTSGRDRERLSDSIVGSLNVVGEWAYYSLATQVYPSVAIGNELLPDGGLYKIRLDGTERTRISDVNTQRFVVDNNWIYYIDSNWYFYRMRTDGTDVTRIIEDGVGSFHLFDDWIYFSTRAPLLLDGALYKMRFDGTERQPIEHADAAITGITVIMGIAGGWLFYSNFGFPISDKIRLDGSEHEHLWDLP